MFRAHAAIN